MAIRDHGKRKSERGLKETWVESTKERVFKVQRRYIYGAMPRVPPNDTSCPSKGSAVCPGHGICMDENNRLNTKKQSFIRTICAPGENQSPIDHTVDSIQPDSPISSSIRESSPVLLSMLVSPSMFIIECPSLNVDKTP